MSENQVNPSQSKDNFELTSHLLKIIGSFSTFSLFVTISGFAIVQIFISKYTSFFVYDISPAQYIGAGISLLFFAPIIFVYLIWRDFGVTVLVLFIFAVLVSIYVGWYVRHHKKDNRTNNERVIAALDLVSIFIAPFVKLSNYLSLMYLIGVAIVIGFLYGAAGYGVVPRWIGGGQPASAILIFKPESTSNPFPFAVINNRSSEVKVLAELSSGLLVWDEPSKSAVKVSNDALIGVLGVSGSNSSPTPPANIAITPTPTA